jgi:hypothetical protein
MALLIVNQCELKKKWEKNITHIKNLIKKESREKPIISYLIFIFFFVFFLFGFFNIKAQKWVSDLINHEGRKC